MLYTRDLIARMLQKEYDGLPLEIAKKVVVKMTDEDICKDFNMKLIRKGYFVQKTI